MISVKFVPSSAYLCKPLNSTFSVSSVVLVEFDAPSTFVSPLYTSNVTIVLNPSLLFASFQAFVTEISLSFNLVTSNLFVIVTSLVSFTS